MEASYSTLIYARNAADAKRGQGYVNVRIVKRGRKYVVKYDAR